MFIFREVGRGLRWEEGQRRALTMLSSRSVVTRLREALMATVWCVAMGFTTNDIGSSTIQFYHSSPRLLVPSSSREIIMTCRFSSPWVTLERPWVHLPCHTVLSALISPSSSPPRFSSSLPSLLPLSLRWD